MSSTKGAQIAVVGSINADTTYRVPRLPGPGETILGTSRLDAPGGKGANQASAIAALGSAVDFVGAVGTDDSGVVISSGLAEKGVGISHLVSVTDAPTGSAVIIVADSGENSIVVHPGANAAVSAKHVRTYLAERSPDIILTQFEIPLGTVEEIGLNFGGSLIVNPAPMPPVGRAVKAIISRADILVPNRTELAALAGMRVPMTLDEVIAAARSVSFEGDLVVTLGSEGAVCFPGGSQAEPVMVQSPEVVAIDTSGAGDAFCGALAVAIQGGKNLVEAVESANAVASWSVTQPGAQVFKEIPKFGLKPD